MRVPFRPLFWFLLPWLIILLVPQLRLAARVVISGSEYVEAGNAYYAHALLPFEWLKPSPPTLTELWRKARSDPQAQIAALLKAPQNRDDTRITFAEARQRYTKALQIAPHDAALLASALQLVVDTSYERAIPPFEKANAFPFVSAWWHSSSSPGDWPTACLTVTPHDDDDRIYRDESEPMVLPLALPPLDDVPVFIASPVQVPWTPPVGAFGAAPGSAAPISGPASPGPAPAPILMPPTTFAANSGQPFGPPVLDAKARHHAVTAIEWAQRGSKIEPNNAWWDWKMVSFYYAAWRDDAALQSLHRASLKTHFDAHRDFQQLVALRAAALHRPLLAEEKVSVWERQFGGDDAGYQRARLIMWSLLSAKRSGEIARSLGIAADAARLGALMQSEARTRYQLGNGLRLQSGAWAAIGGPVQRKGRPMASPSSHVLSSVPLQRSNYGPNPRATPLDFARQFASVARRAGRADLAGEALHQAREAGPRQLEIMRPEINWNHVITPDALVPLDMAKGMAWMTLAQGRLVLLVWLAGCFLLWPPLWKLGHPAARWWRRFIVAWRGQTIHAAPPADAPHDVTRDVRAALWTSATITALCSAIALVWEAGAILPEVLWPLNAQRSFYSALGPDSVLGLDCMIACLIAPLIGAALWSVFPPLRRLLRVHRQTVPPRDANAALWLRPLLWAFVAWSAIFYAALSWLLSVLRDTGVLNLSSFISGNMPRSWRAGEGFFAILSFWEWESLLYQITDWMSDFTGAGWLTGGASALWILKWHCELPAIWRWSALHATLLRLRRVTFAWLPLTGWLFLIFLLASQPYRRAADAQFEQQLSQPQMAFETPDNSE